MTTTEQLHKIIQAGIELGKRNNVSGYKIDQEGEDIILSTSYYIGMEPGAWVSEATHVQRIRPDGASEVIRRGK